VTVAFGVVFHVIDQIRVYYTLLAEVMHLSLHVFHVKLTKYEFILHCEIELFVFSKPSFIAVICSAKLKAACGVKRLMRRARWYIKTHEFVKF
jgi:hypothetical protein